MYGRGGASGVAYAASKAALIAVTKAIAHEGAPHITANAILPGPTAREHPSERDGEVKIVEGTEPNALGYTNPATSWLGRFPLHRITSLFIFLLILRPLCKETSSSSSEQVLAQWSTGHP